MTTPARSQAHQTGSRDKRTRFLFTSRPGTKRLCFPGRAGLAGRRGPVRRAGGAECLLCAPQCPRGLGPGCGPLSGGCPCFAPGTAQLSERTQAGTVASRPRFLFSFPFSTGPHPGEGLGMNLNVTINPCLLFLRLQEAACRGRSAEWSCPPARWPLAPARSSIT